MTKRIKVLEKHPGVTGYPLRVGVRDDETGEFLTLEEDAKLPFQARRPMLRTGNTCDLLMLVFMNLPKWAVWPGANDSAYIDRITQAVFTERNKSTGFIVLTDGDYNWLHGVGESETGKGNGRVGLFDRKEPTGGTDPEDVQRDTVGNFVFGLNEARYRRALEVPKSQAQGKPEGAAASEGDDES